MRVVAEASSSRRDMLLAGIATSGVTSTRQPIQQPYSIPRIQIAPNLEISKVIKGCWQLSGGHRGESATDRTTGKEAIQDIHTFVNAGITTLDTADIYGPSEKIIGSYRNMYPEESRTCQVLTKFCCFGESMLQAAKKDFVAISINRSRKAIGVDSLDCVQFFWADYGVKNYVSAGLSLSDLKEEGVVKTLGVTNFDVERLDEMVQAGVPIATNQIQYSLLDTRPENGMTEYCKQHNIVILPFGTVAGGFLSDKYLGKSPREVKMNTYSLQKYASIIGQRGGWEWFQSLLRTLDTVARKHSVSIADVASRWVLQREGVGAIIVGARNASHVKEHGRLFQFVLDSQDLSQIQDVLESGNKPSSDVYTFERGGRW